LIDQPFIDHIHRDLERGRTPESRSGQGKRQVVRRSPLRGSWVLGQGFPT